ncbi:hypothetical protein BJX66DRAFT_337717 [Aspergillus keveii]|uniref:Rhodopsin domain-containing protein n=1 Tax=Aspergillus keveii TaxID=714993 RepID=A0ABR4G6D4_9EURO
MAVGLRLYTRIRITHTLGLDGAFSVLVLDIPPPAIADGMKLNLISMLLFGFSSTFIRVSLLWFFLRLLGPGVRTDIRVWKYWLAIAMVLVSALAIIFGLLLLFQCTPVRAAWEIDPDYDYHCLNEHTILLAANVQNVFTDFLAVATPAPVVCRLRVSKRHRAIVVALFSLGLGAVAVGIYRTIYLHIVHDDADFSWHLTTAFITSTVELGLGLIGSCAPALRPFLATVMPGLVQSSAVPTAPPPDTFGALISCS